MADPAPLRLYRDMLRIRMVEERIAAVYSEQEMRCPVHLCIGQEAVAVGVCAALDRADYAMSGHRSHGHYLAKGGDLRAMLAEIYGRAAGCSGGKGGSMHLIDRAAGFMGATPIVASTIPIAVGLAFASKLRGDGRVTVAFFGEAAIETGVFHESVNFAVLKQLPIVFVCENNLYSVYSPLSVRQPAGRSVHEAVSGHGIASLQGDGNDVLEVQTFAAQAVATARNGSGPAFVEFMTYRWREHCGPLYDNGLGYRTPEEFEGWRTKCPVRTFEQRLLLDAAVDREALAGITAALSAEIDEAFAFARAASPPDPTALFDDIYA